MFSQINTQDGPKQVWTTFGPDQIDLNWHNPKMTLEFLNLIITYLSNGIFQGYSKDFQNNVVTNREKCLFSPDVSVIEGSITVSF